MPHIVLTGASGGLGWALAEAYAGPGVHLHLTGRDATRLSALAETCRARGAVVATTALDLAMPGAAADFARDVDAERPVDVALACAGLTSSVRGDGCGETPEAVARVFAVNTLAVASAKDFSNQYPLIGSEVERNYATCVYNELLSDWCADTPGVYFFSAHTRLMTPDLETRSEYFGDGCHLNHRGIDLVIEAFKRTVEANGLDLPDFFRPRQDLLRPEVTLVDIAPRCRVLAVSSSYHKTPVKALWGTPYFFHTDQDDEPHIQLDLGYMASIARLDVYNRTECAKERARFLVVEAGPTLSRLEVVYRHDGTVFGQDGSPLLIENFNGPVRYLRCSLAEKQYFHLSRLRILARTYRGRA